MKPVCECPLRTHNGLKYVSLQYLSIGLRDGSRLAKGVKGRVQNLWTTPSFTEATMFSNGQYSEVHFGYVCKLVFYCCKRWINPILGRMGSIVFSAQQRVCIFCVFSFDDMGSAAPKPSSHPTMTPLDPSQGLHTAAKLNWIMSDYAL